MEVMPRRIAKIIKPQRLWLSPAGPAPAVNNCLNLRLGNSVRGQAVRL
jgi:hypothetical protein